MDAVNLTPRRRNLHCGRTAAQLPFLNPQLHEPALAFIASGRRCHTGLQRRDISRRDHAMRSGPDLPQPRPLGPR